MNTKWSRMITKGSKMITKCSQMITKWSQMTPKLPQMTTKGEGNARRGVEMVSDMREMEKREMFE